MTRRYTVEDEDPDNPVDRKPESAEPWKGRAWFEEDADRSWSVTVEPDGNGADNRLCSTLAEASLFAMRDRRIVQVLLGPPR